MRDFHDHVRDVLDYDPNTGVFRWRVSFNAIKCGDVAGSVDERGRPRIYLQGTRYMASRMAWYWMTGAWPRAEVDHINGDHADNRWSNLREATRSQNECNKDPKSNNTSGFKGIRKVGNRWRAVIHKNGKGHHLGYFDNSDEAREAYIDAAKELHGEYAKY